MTPASQPSGSAALDLRDPGGADAAALPVALGAGTVLLRGLARGCEQQLQAGLQELLAHSPFRFMTTPGGYRMSVAMSNCGVLGWVSDRSGYRYSPLDPLSGRIWPAMPSVFRQLAVQAARCAGFAAFAPDACLINRYVPGARLSLHQDRDEMDMSSPIVSVSLGLPAMFLLGGLRRSERPQRVPLLHGDVLVFGGPGRLRFHGVRPLEAGGHHLMGECRVNLSFRKAG
jgi:DNA oxidative demethylase